jgi:hypothetical protein
LLTTFSAYCEDKPKCTNDGGEFKLHDGKFVNAKVRRDLSFFETIRDTETNATSAGFRKFRGEDDVERLWLNTEQEGTLVGENLWTAAGPVQITEEIFN